MNAVVNVIILIIGFVIGFFVNSQIYLPLIYGLPKSIWYFLKGELRFKGVIAQFIPPAIWILIIIVVAVVFELINPEINNFLLNRSAFGAGWTLSFLALLLNFLSVSGRATMKAEFDQNTLEKYKKIND